MCPTMGPHRTLQSHPAAGTWDSSQCPSASPWHFRHKKRSNLILDTFLRAR